MTINSFLIAQLVGVVAAIVSIVIVQFKKIEHILIGEILSNATIAATYVFLGGWSGASLCIAASIHTVTSFWFNKRSRAYPIWLTVLFELVYIACSVFSYKGIIDILSCIAAMLFGLAVIQDSAAKYRLLMLFNALLWIVYDIGTKAYTTIFTHSFIAVSILTAIIRLDIQNKEQQ